MGRISWAFFRLSRPINLLIVFLSQYFTLQFLIFPDCNLSENLGRSAFWITTLATILSTAAGYWINDYYDIKIDAVNKPNSVIIDKELARRKVLLAQWVINFLAAGLAYFGGKGVFAIVVFSQMLLWVYAIFLKKTPFLGNILVSALTALSLIILLPAFQVFSLKVLAYAVFAFFISLVREIVKDMQDIRGDKKHGARTLPIKYGIRKTKYLVFVILFLFLIASYSTTYFLNNLFLVPFGLLIVLSLIFISFSLYRADTSRKFGRLSTVLKVIMIFGILSMTLVE